MPIIILATHFMVNLSIYIKYYLLDAFLQYALGVFGYIIPPNPSFKSDGTIK